MKRVVVALLGLFALLGTGLAQEQDSLRITNPVGGEVYFTNRVTLVTIRWEGVDDTSSIRLEWSLDGSNWNTIVDSARFLSHIWDISNLPVATSYRIRATLERPPSGSDNVVYDGHGFPVFDAAWSPDGTRVVSSSIEPHIWDPVIGGSTPETILQTAFGEIHSLAWSEDSTRIAIASNAGFATVFDARTNLIEVTIQHPDPVKKLDLGSDSQTLLTQCDDNRGRAFNLPSDVIAGTFNPAATLNDVSLSKQMDKSLICANDGRVYRLSGGLPVIFRGHSSGVLKGDWHPSGTAVVTIGGDATVKVWNPTNAAEIWSASDPVEGIRCVAYSPDGTMVATGMSDSTAIIWDATNGDRLATVPGHSRAVRVLAWSPQNDLLATGSDDNFVKVYDLALNKVTHNLAHIDNITSVSWDPEGNRLLSTSDDRTARVWRIRSIIVQRDTTATFSIADPPPAFARFVAKGGTLAIGETARIPVLLEGASDIDLSDIDSVRLSFRYNATILHRLSASVPIISERDSADQILITMKAIPLPNEDGELFNFEVRATLGTDSLTAFTITRVEQIGQGSGVRVETRAEPILITGICRSSEDPRLFIPSGSLLSVRQVHSPSEIIVEIDLAESGPTNVYFYDIMGRLLWSDVATSHEESARHLSRVIPLVRARQTGFVVVVTSTDVRSLLVGVQQ